ncbi:MAG TPA: T9SS type A sorting domain-containing protein, partial [Ignavibacteria bacterium]|nr:T9SS type A sorting domain-containing protein [Ignavibacteria bacterium]
SLPLPSKGGAQAVKLVIYDILGREIASLIPRGQEGLSPGVYEVEFDGANYPSGVYFYKIFTENYSKTLKMVLIK